MGIDAEMYMTWDQALSDDKLRQFSWALAEAFLKRPFWISEKEGALGRKNQEWEPLLEGETQLQVNVFGRYYGEGYERGPVHDYLAIAEWLERRFPGCRVFYGGDSDLGATLFDKRRRDELLRYWAVHGHIPYRGYNDEHPPTCDFCLMPMTVGRWGPRQQRKAYCAGCYRTSGSVDGGKNWEPQVWEKP